MRSPQHLFASEYHGFHCKILMPTFAYIYIYITIIAVAGAIVPIDITQTRFQIYVSAAFIRCCSSNFLRRSRASASTLACSRFFSSSRCHSQTSEREAALGMQSSHPLQDSSEPLRGRVRHRKTMKEKRYMTQSDTEHIPSRSVPEPSFLTQEQPPEYAIPRTC